MSSPPDPESTTLVLGSPSGEFVSVRPLRQLRPPAAGPDDGNWSRCAVEARVGVFRAAFECNLRLEAFQLLRTGLSELHLKLSGRAVFDGMEPWISFRMEGDGKGHVACAFELRDPDVVGNVLRVVLELDQTRLAPMIAQLDRILAELPVVERH